MRRAATGTFIALLTAGGILGLACSSGDDDDNDNDGLYMPGTGGSSFSSSDDDDSSSGNDDDDDSSSGNDDDDDSSSGNDDDDDSASTGGKGTGGRSSTTPSTGGRQGSYVKPCQGNLIPEDEREKNACQEETYATEPVPVDLVIMMDRSISLAEELPGLGMTRWDGMVQAMETFVSNPAVLRKGVRVSLQFFSQTAGFVPATDCDVNNYFNQLIPMGDLADVGQGIVDEMAARQPSGQTPTAPALTGALMYARQWATSSASGGRATAVLLVSDGMPTQCQDPISVVKIAQLAEEYYNPPVPSDGSEPPPSIPTFVVGLGPATHNLDQIAYAGGTDEAYAVDLDANAADAFAEVLSKITNAKMTCEFIIPPTLMEENVIMDYDENRIWYTPLDSTEVQQIPQLNSEADCNGNTYGGWYYKYPDGSSTPERLAVCPCTCTLFRTGDINIQWGCSPVGL